MDAVQTENEGGRSGYLRSLAMDFWAIPSDLFAQPIVVTVMKAKKVYIFKGILRSFIS